MNRKSLAVTVGGILVALGISLWASGVFANGNTPTHYVALGDSLAAGQGASVPDQFGYVGRFNQFYRVNHRGPERLANLAVPGETSASLLGDQIAGAVEAINDTDTDTQVVTLTIGSNDFLPLMRSEPCVSNPVSLACQAVVAQSLQSFAANYQGILTQLTAALAADPGAERVLVTTYYNPFDGTGNPFEGPIDMALMGIDGTIDCAANAVDSTKVGLNDLITCIGGAFGAETVDIYPIFNNQALALTHIGEGDVHPNDEGYRLIADAVIATYSGG